MEAENTPLGKGETSINHQFLGFQPLVLRGVSSQSPLIPSRDGQLQAQILTAQREKRKVLREPLPGELGSTFADVSLVIFHGILPW